MSLAEHLCLQWTARGNIAFATYKSTGYKIAFLKNFQEKDPSELGSYKRPDKINKQIFIIGYSAGRKRI